MSFGRCPRAWLAREAGEELVLYEEYSWWRRNGALPIAGGLYDQSPRFLDGAGVIEDELAAIEESHRRQAEKRR